jgi:hypothetical protein
LTGSSVAIRDVAVQKWSHSMTRHIALAALAAALLMASALDAGAGQRPRTAPQPSDTADGSDARSAQPREAEPRKAEPRPAQTPAAEAPETKAKTEPPAPPPAPPASRESSRSANSVVVTPTVVVPSTVDGLTVGKSFTVGNSFSVGHGASEPSESDQRSPRRRDRSDRDSVNTVFVPVPVYVPVDDSEPPVASVPALPSSAGASSLADVARASRRVNVPRSYFTFSPWYNVDSAIVAGYPVPLPSPSTFSEGNISSTVAETRRETNGTTDTVSVIDYAKDVGGVAFAVSPADAGVYVDGRFVGSVGDYSPQREPLLLRFGVYNIELRARGYVTERIAAYVTAGEVVPFSGTLVKAQP